MEFKNGETLIVVHFGELWLKGRNRGKYLKQLERNIGEQLSGESYRLQRYFDRMLLRLDKESNAGSIIARLRRVFGISRVELATATKPTLASIASTSKKMLSVEPVPKSLKIDSHRSYKQLPFDSMDIVRKLKSVAEGLGIDPTTKGYEKQLNVSVTKDAAFLSLENEKGAGGLPVGSSGRAVVLISGGIDSPVAAWYAMKRGLEPVYVHLHAFQTNEQAADGKVADIIELLSQYCPHYSLYLVPSHIFQATSFKFGKYELILLKAFMLRLAEAIAEREDARVIFTGESLGQVASQTPENLGAEQYGIKSPILRPLIGFDKEEIIRVARELGTYNESIKPYRDVCSINAKNPKLNAGQKAVAGMLKRMKMKSIVSRSLRASKLVSA